MVGQLANDEADIILSAISFTLDRTTAIDLTSSLITTLVTMTGLKPEKTITGGYKAFLKVFSSTTWIGLITLAIAVGATTSIVLGNKNALGFFKNFQLGTIVLGFSCLQLGNVISGISPSWRMLQVTIALCGYLCFTAYTSDLTAILTVGQLSHLPKNFKQIISHDYRILAAKGSWPVDHMKSRPLGSIMRKVYDNHTTLFTYDGDMKAMLHKLSVDPKLLYYGDSLQFYKHNNLQIVKDFDERTLIKLSIGLQKDSELLSLFNHHILKMGQSGLLSKLSRKWIHDDNPGDWSERIFVDEATAIGFSNVVFVLLVLACGAALAIILACIEKIEECRK